MGKMEGIGVGEGKGKAHPKGVTQKVKNFQGVSRKSSLNFIFFL
jgi:hypothetical protein